MATATLLIDVSSDKKAQLASLRTDLENQLPTFAKYLGINLQSPIKVSITEEKQITVAILFDLHSIKKGKTQNRKAIIFREELTSFCQSRMNKHDIAGKMAVSMVQ